VTTMNHIIITIFILTLIGVAAFSFGHLHDYVRSKKQKRIDAMVDDLLQDADIFSDTKRVVDANYNDVYDLQEYRERKNRERENKKEKEETEWAVLWSKRDEKFIKVPREFADLITYLKKNPDHLK